MMAHRKSENSIQILFPILLFCIFSICAIMVVTLGAKVYSSTVDRASRCYTARTSLSYITEKIHQNDKSGVISTVQKNGRSILILKEHGYSTYIYVYDGSLCELTAENGAKVDTSSDTEITPLADMKITEKKNGLLEIKCTDKKGSTRRALVNVHTAGSGKEDDHVS